MIVFLIYCVPCSLIGMFLAAMLTANSYTRKGHVIGFILITLIVTAFFAAGFTVEYYQDEQIWNGGICPDCRGNYEFVNASHYRGHTAYYWECDGCGAIIETSSNMKE